jgi:hypothetical protein
MSFHILADILAKSSQKKKFKQGLKKARVFEIARQSIGKLFKINKSSLKRKLDFSLENYSLIIQCTDNYLAQEIRLHQGELRKYINKRLDDQSVQKIRVKVGRYFN